MGTFLIKTFFEGLPKDVFEAGVIDGASDSTMFTVIAIPLAVPILATQGLMTFMGVYNDYLWPSLILRKESLKTTSVVLKNFTNTLFNETNSMCVAIAGYVIASLPMFFIFALCSKQFVKGLTSGAFKM
jgi:ABC-type glycerol-3-phosphate transport system permease component